MENSNKTDLNAAKSQNVNDRLDKVREALEYIAELDKPIEGASECFRPYMERAREALSMLPKVKTREEFLEWCRMQRDGPMSGRSDPCWDEIYDFLVGGGKL